jgi:hypothetical protein
MVKMRLPILSKGYISWFRALRWGRFHATQSTARLLMSTSNLAAGSYTLNAILGEGMTREGSE